MLITLDPANVALLSGGSALVAEVLGHTKVYEDFDNGTVDHVVAAPAEVLRYQTG